MRGYCGSDLRETLFREKEIMIYVIPAIIILVLAAALRKKLPVYELFIDGVGEGMKIITGIFPPLRKIL